MLKVCAREHDLGSFPFFSQNVEGTCFGGFPPLMTFIAEESVTRPGRAQRPTFSATMLLLVLPLGAGMLAMPALPPRCCARTGVGMIRLVHQPRAQLDASSQSFVASACANVAPSLALVMSSSSSSGDAPQGCACAIQVGSEKFLLTSSVVASSSSSKIVKVTLPADNYQERHDATIVSSSPDVDLALLSLPAGASMPPALSLGDSGAVAEGDFVIALGNPTSDLRGGASLGMLSSRSELPSLAPPPEDGVPPRRPPPGTAEAAMVEAEAEAEAEALRRGELPFLVTTAATAEGFMRGGPLLSDDGAVLGINTLVISAPGESSSTTYYSVTAQRATRAIDAMLERRSLGEQVGGAALGSPC